MFNMDLEELGYYIFMSEAEKEQEIHNENNNDLEAEQTTYNTFTGK